MMFEAHIAYGVTLLALVAAATLLGFSAKIEVCCKSLMKIISYLVLILGALNLLCITYYTLESWEDGYFKTPHGQSCHMMNGQGGMMHMMGGGMMNGMKGQGNMPNLNQMPTNDTTDKDHDEHHSDQGN